MRTKFLAVLAVTTVALATFTPASLAGTAAKKFTGDPIVLGVTSSVDAATPPNVPGLEEAAIAAAKSLNAKGGVTTADGLTHEVEITYCNNKNDKAQTAACARDFIDAGVDAVVGSAVTNSDEIVPLLESAGIAYFFPIAMGTGLPEMTTSNSFIIYVTPVLFVGSAIELAKAGYSKTAVVYLPAGKLLIPAVKAGLESEGGSIVKEVEVPQTSPNWTSIVADATEGSDSLALILDENNATPFIAALAQGGKKVPISTVAAIVTDETLKATGGKKSPIVGSKYVSSPFALPQAKAWKDFRASMKKYASKIRLESTTQQTWLSVTALASIIAKIDGTVDNTSVLAQLNQTSDVGTFGGKLPPGIDFTTSKSAVLSRVFNPDYYGPIAVTGNGLVEGKGAKFSEAFALLLKALGM